MRHTWRDSVATAADLAVLGFLVTLAALPVVTVGAAVLTGSRAVAVYLREDRWPPARECRAVFRRAVRPGLAGTVLVGVSAGLLAADFGAVRSGVVPGGVPMMVGLLVAALAGAGMLGLAIVRRERVTAVRPPAVAAAAAVTGLAVLLALLVHPVLIPVLVGYWLFALHVGTARAETAGSRPVTPPRSDDPAGVTGVR